jgi:cyclic pyranopterin phosphate synthase
LTGGEPLLRSDLIGLVGALRERLPWADLALTTNGTRLAGQARSLRDAGIRALNVSLDAPDADGFAALAGRAAFGDVVAGLEAARTAEFNRLKINAVLLRSTNRGCLSDLVRLGVHHGCDEVRFIELMPLGPAARIYDAERVRADEAFDELRRELRYLGPLGRAGTALRHRFALDDGREIVIGLIAPVSRPFCSGCDRLRLDPRGRLHACLREEAGVELAPLLARDRGVLESAIRGVLDDKKRAGARWPERAMMAIGG